MANGYLITSVGISQELGPTGNLVDVVVATWETVPEGGSGTVSVPRSGDWESALEAAVIRDSEAMLRLLGR